MSTPIIALDHVTVLTADLDRAVADYELLLGRGVAWRSTGDGAATALFTVSNMSLELMAPAGEGDDGARVKAALEAKGEGLASLCFRVDDAARMHRRLSRLQMQPEPVSEKSAVNTLDGTMLAWRRTRSATAVNHGVRLFYVARDAERPLSAAIAEPAVRGLDHVVVTTPDPERAAALYGARLGLDMRLDLSRPDWGARLMFFRCGDLIVEIAHHLGKAPASSDDRLMGLSWRVDDAEAARARLAAAGVEVSAVRAGRKPGTRIFTVKNRSAGVPTLMIEPATKPA